jgi:predicted negative regulator of RcsB-dependent stress response
METRDIVAIAVSVPIIIFMLAVFGWTAWTETHPKDLGDL